ncbi:dehydrogenase/reductase SDR family member on chromosome X [Chanos chanos]|uniref:Dehydrogenase/reductase SDR family member on chromosome X n=1 Tax=Chanos chanos TaxID=29144 RepID=A0A6J2WCD4_CHACN|nr:dehydrogenase/reductase SDR family member on chromosome X-like [Chanos chanos]
MSVLAYILPLLRLYLIGVKVLLHQLLNSAFTLPVLPRQNGRVAIVTGGSRGLGYETARQLASLGMHVIIASSHEEEGLAAVKRIQEESKDRKVEFLKLDLASLESIRQFAQNFKKRGIQLHVLINNAAVMLVPEKRTEDGFESHFCVNYLGHFLLTNLLLHCLWDSGKDDLFARIINISSSAHYVGDLTLEDLQSTQGYSAHAAYAQSKLAQILFTYRLQQMLTASAAPVTVNAVDPGMVDTDLYRHLWSPARLAKRPVAWLLFRTPAQGAATGVYAAVSPDMEGVGGCYLHNGQRTQSSLASYDEVLQERLWKKSCRLLGLGDSWLA